jgi:hypothetical protein
VGGYGFDVEGTLRDDAQERHIASAERRTRGVLGKVVQRLLFGALDDTYFPRFATQPDKALTRDVFGELRDFVARTTADPWPSTRAVLDTYLDTAGEVSFRGTQEREDAPWTFTLAFTFSGCAGLGEVSARVATHWAQLWWRSEHARVSERLLAPRGFAVASAPGDPEPMFFLPAGDAGYAEFLPDVDPADSDPEWPTYPFEVDVAAEEAGFDHAAKTLSEQFADRFTPRGCHCQLCDPDFDEATVARALDASD